MRSSRVISISLPEAQADAAAKLAASENRTMSELFREAFRLYERERRQETLRPYRQRAASTGLTEEDVVRIVHEYRKTKVAAKPKSR